MSNPIQIENTSFLLNVIQTPIKTCNELGIRNQIVDSRIDNFGSTSTTVTPVCKVINNLENNYDNRIMAHRFAQLDHISKYLYNLKMEDSNNDYFLIDNKNIKSDKNDNNFNDVEAPVDTISELASCGNAPFVPCPPIMLPLYDNEMHVNHLDKKYSLKEDPRTTPMSKINNEKILLSIENVLLNDKRNYNHDENNNNNNLQIKKHLYSTRLFLYLMMNITLIFMTVRRSI